MDIIVLGLLMMQNCTIYEMRKYIDTWLTNVSSNSIGSIQATIKKLSEKGFIVFTEHVENSVNKKIYAITPEGKTYFMSRLSSPMLYKEKNMELSKFFFMGFTDQESWTDLLDSYIGELQKELDALEQIGAALLPRYAFDEAQLAAQHQKGADDEITLERARNVARFQYGTLDLSLAQVKFQIKWFEDFKRSLTNQEESDENK